MAHPSPGTLSPSSAPPYSPINSQKSAPARPLSLIPPIPAGAKERHPNSSAATLAFSLASNVLSSFGYCRRLHPTRLHRLRPPAPTRLPRKARHLCPACHQRWTLQSARWIAHHVCLPVPHRQFVFTLSKVLRPIFRKRRHLLTHLFHTATTCLRDAFRTQTHRERRRHRRRVAFLGVGWRNGRRCMCMGARIRIR